MFAQYRGPSDPETGGAFTVKAYESSKTLDSDGLVVIHEIRLKPLNSDFQPIVITVEDGEEIAVLAEFVDVLAV